ncbi:rod shape-determining protein RodA [Paenibacillus donghaensis]|uniref:FtsW/RodA/SpoVE family cell cycle protein n=1 Tax=Paenibacillus donghaensis TaxID=414771 RepID=UPI0018836E9F|nr:FtsW/RodA/SpoVE family cell cycle protein [Paenibacillus donghaensis]MBE9913579.1 rod shape-determining protein RodA [Paenibacillus donghaensis]
MINFRLLAKLDKSTLFIVCCLVAIGTVAVYRATEGTHLEGLHMSNIYLFAAFCIPMLGLSILDYRILLGKLSYILYGIGIGMLVLVKFAGENINGAARWLNIGHFQLQPSELAKIFTVLLIAHLLGKREGRQLRFVQDLLPIGCVFLIPFILIMDQPDLGTALVFLGIVLSMLWIGNIRSIYMILFIGMVILIICTVLWLYYANYELLSKIVEPHQMSRIQTFLDPTSDPDKSWHVKNAMKAIGMGGLSGSDGAYVRKGFIPYVYSDSIYVVIGEEFGFIGSSVLLILYLALVYRMIHVSMESKELSGTYIVVGFIGMLVFQVSVNIGMHIGILPLTGISLPFISYGGSSLLTNMIAIGLILSVNAHHDEATWRNHDLSKTEKTESVPITKRLMQLGKNKNA